MKKLLQYEEIKKQVKGSFPELYANKRDLEENTCHPN